MNGSHTQKGLLPAGLSDILYPKAQVQAKKQTQHLVLEPVLAVPAMAVVAEMAAM